jgi:hypothetical protein
MGSCFTTTGEGEKLALLDDPDTPLKTKVEDEEMTLFAVGA